MIFSFQGIGVDFLKHHRRALLADSPGLGKTLQALLAIAESLALPALIVCPARLRLNWRREIEKWMPEQSELFTVISYEGLVSGKAGENGQFQSFVFDECHALKTKSTQRFIAASELLKDQQDKIVILLTGTPIINQPSELKNLLSLISFSPEDIYAEYEKTKTSGGICRFNPTLPILGRTTQFVRETCPEAIPYLAIDRQVEKLPNPSLTPYLDAFQGSKDHVLAIIHKLRVEAFKEKLDSLIKIIKENKNDKKIVFTWFKMHGKELAEIFPESHYIDGDVPFEEREEIIEKFHNDDSNILIATLPSCGEGLNITCATAVIFAELPWTHAAIEQGESRCCRIGQTKNTCSIIIFKQNSIEEDVWELILQKKSYLDDLHEGDLKNIIIDKIKAAIKNKQAQGAGLDAPLQFQGFKGFQKERFERDGKFDVYIKWTKPNMSIQGTYIGKIEKDGSFGKYSIGSIIDNENIIAAFSKPILLEKALNKIKPGQEIKITYIGQFESDFTPGRFFKKFVITTGENHDNQPNFVLAQQS